MQKRLILHNLCELYQAFKEEYPVVQIGFLKFCLLRPKWCIIARASGTHFVCVGFIHLNVKLLVDALPNNISYNVMLKPIVCDNKNRECMMCQCDQWPDDSELRTYLCELLQGFDDISIKQ